MPPSHPCVSSVSHHPQSVFIHGDKNNQRRHRDISLKMKMNFCNICLFAVQIITIMICDIHSILCFLKFFNPVAISILTLLLHICDTASHYCIFLCWIRPWRWPKKAKICRRFITCLYIIVSNGSAVVCVDIYIYIYVCVCVYIYLYTWCFVK
jgi:hypothetical protein